MADHMLDTEAADLLHMKSHLDDLATYWHGGNAASQQVLPHKLHADPLWSQSMQSALV